MTAGASGAFILAFLAAFDAGDAGRRRRAGLSGLSQHPGGPGHRGGAGARPMPPTRFQPTPDQLDADRRAASTGWSWRARPIPPAPCCTRDELARSGRLVRAAAASGSSRDEIYHGITYGEPAETASRRAGTRSSSTASRSIFCMTGWRLGWLVLPERPGRVRSTRLAQNLFISPRPWRSMRRLACVRRRRRARRRGIESYGATATAS